MRSGAPVGVALCALAAALACGGAGTPPVREVQPVPDGGGTPLTLGSVSYAPAHEHEVYRVFLDALVERLADVGVGSGRVVVESSLGRMAERIAAGEVDLYMDSPFPVALVVSQTGAKPLLRRWKKGTAEYSSVVFARRDSDVVGLADLRGHVIGFGEPFSTSSYLLPKARMVAAGMVLERYEDLAAEVPDDRVGYVFTRDAENTMIWVLKNRIVAGAVNADYFEEMAGIRRHELRVLLETGKVPRNVVCVRAGMEPELEGAIEEALLGLHRDEAGRKALARFEGTTRFDRFPVDPRQALRPVFDLLGHVEDDLGRPRSPGVAGPVDGGPGP